MKRYRTLSVITTASLLCLTGCVGNGSGDTPSNPEPTPTAEHPIPGINKDPTKGWVTILDRNTVQYDFDSTGWATHIGLAKFCDGLTMVYVASSADGGAPGISTIPQSPECNPAKG